MPTAANWRKMPPCLPITRLPTRTCTATPPTYAANPIPIPQVGVSRASNTLGLQLSAQLNATGVDWAKCRDHLAYIAQLNRIPDNPGLMSKPVMRQLARVWEMARTHIPGLVEFRLSNQPTRCACPACSTL